MTDTRIIITETPNGLGFVKNAFRCNDEADFIARICEAALRSDDNIDTVKDALRFLDERHAQKTEIITKADFDKIAADSWDTAVLKEAEKLGWYEAPSEDDDEDE